MPSRGKKKTTMAKLNRETRLRQRRVEKQIRKEARRDAAAASPEGEPSPTEDSTGSIGPDAASPPRGL
jgi:hypothetical protein